MNTAAKKRKSIKIVNQGTFANSDTVIVSGGIGEVCIETLEETLTSAQGRKVSVGISDAFSNAIGIRPRTKE